MTCHIYVVRSRLEPFLNFRIKRKLPCARHAISQSPFRYTYVHSFAVFLSYHLAQNVGEARIVRVFVLLIYARVCQMLGRESYTSESMYTPSPPESFIFSCTSREQNMKIIHAYLFRLQMTYLKLLSATHTLPYPSLTAPEHLDLRALCFRNKHPKDTTSECIDFRTKRYFHVDRCMGGCF